MSQIEIQPIESEDQKNAAGALIREYLEWLNERLKREYEIAFDAEATVHSDVPDPVSQ